jgi:hypothetical protein
MAIAVSCPHCDGRLKLADKLAAKTVKCPKCGKAFKAASEEDDELDEAIEERKERPAPSRSRRERDDDEDDDDRPRSRRHDDDDEDDDDDDRPRRSRRKSKQKKSNTGLIIGLCAGGGVLVLVLGLVLVLTLRSRAPAANQAGLQANAGPPPNGAQPPVVPNAKPQEPKPQPPAPQPVQPPEVKKTAPMNANPGPAVPVTGVPLKPGTRITVKSQVQGSPPEFAGDYNMQLTQKIELALRELSLEPVAEGGLNLTISAQLSDTGKTMKVRTDSFPVPQIAATMLLTDPQGTAIWKQEGKFTLPKILVLRTNNPGREIQERVWQSFETWARGKGLASLKAPDAK